MTIIVQWLKKAVVATCRRYYLHQNKSRSYPRHGFVATCDKKNGANCLQSDTNGRATSDSRNINLSFEIIPWDDVRELIIVSTIHRIRSFLTRSVCSVLFFSSAFATCQAPSMPIRFPEMLSSCSVSLSARACPTSRAPSSDRPFIERSRCVKESFFWNEIPTQSSLITFQLGSHIFGILCML